jgi:uncharacterized membrane protein
MVAVAALALCWPAGLALLAQNKHLSKPTKAVIVVSWFGLALALLAYRLSAARAVSP